MPLVSPDHRCPGNSRTCDQNVDGNPEFTWSIVAAGDLREGRNEKNGKKTGSPQGWEEGKNEGITFPRFRGISFFNLLHAPIFSARVIKNASPITLGAPFVSFVVASCFGAVHYGAPLCSAPA